MNIIVEFYSQENSLFQFSLSHLSLEKLEKENGLNFYCAVAQPSKWPGPTRHTRARSHPGRNVGLGRQSAAARSPAWAAEWPASSPPSALIRRSPGLFARTKTRRRGRQPQNPSLISFSLSLSRVSLSQQRAAHERQRAAPEEKTKTAPPRALLSASALPVGRARRHQAAPCWCPVPIPAWMHLGDEHRRSPVFPARRRRWQR